jgi:CheY-like chemotaxis protein
VTNQSEDDAVETVLVVEHEVMVRHAISEYLRHCGYRVIEATSAEDAITVMSSADVTVDSVFSAIELGGGMNGFALSQWVRDHKAGIGVILAGTVEKAAHEAGDLCEEGPHLAKPYEPSQVIDWIKKLRNLKLPK